MIRFVFCAFSMAILLISCSPVYVPNVRNAPLFTKGGEFQGAMQFGTSGIDAQAAVAITNNLAIMGNYSYGNRNTDTLYDNSKDNYHKHKFYEGGIGYYKNDDKFCFEIFLGYGRGEGTSYGSYSIFSSSEDVLATGKYTRIFLQPSFGLNKKFVHVAFTPRFSMVEFTEFSTTSSSAPIVKGGLEPKIFVEPAVTARFNFLDNRFFGTIQVGVSTSLTDNTAFDYEPFNIATGIGFRLGGLRWNEDETKEKK
jgi:hypothetical protein